MRTQPIFSESCTDSFYEIPCSLGTWVSYYPLNIPLTLFFLPKMFYFSLPAPPHLSVIGLNTISSKNKNPYLFSPTRIYLSYLHMFITFLGKIVINITIYYHVSVTILVTFSYVTSFNSLKVIWGGLLSLPPLLPLFKMRELRR